MRKFQNRIFMTRTVKAEIPWDLILFIVSIVQNMPKDIEVDYLQVIDIQNNTLIHKQEEPEYKIGDWVVVRNYVQCGEGNGVVTTNLVSELFEVGKNGATGMHYKESAFSVKERGNYYNIKEWHIVRKATPEEIKSAQTPQITINGYKGEFFDWGISFNSGCAKIQKEIFISLSKHIGQKFEYTNREVESITIGKGTFTKEQIKEIAEFYLNK